MSELLTHALEYARRGWPVFPCEEAGKHPLTINGFKDATVDPEQIRRWWAKWPRSNIGVPTGLASGIAVVDLDGQTGADTLQTLISEHGPVPETPHSITGNGRHLLFACPMPPITNTQGDKGMGLGVGIDTRGEGGYIIVPPSIHPSGALYHWGEPCDELAPLPDWLTPKKRTTSTTPLKITPIEDPGDHLRRASAYLATMPPAVQGLGGHSCLYAAATALVHGFELTQEEAYQLLASEFNPRCTPAWDLADTKDGRDFRRKISQAATQPHDQPKGWLLHEPLSVSSDVESGRQTAQVFLAGSKPAAPPPPAPRPRPGYRGLPDEMVEPTGLVGRVTSWLNESAMMPQPELALANALSFVGALVGRKVRTPTDLRSNLYCLGVAEASSGKDHSRKAIKQLCSAAGITDKILGGEEVSSDAAILTAVHARPSLLFQFDEIGHMITTINARNAMSYQRAIPATLTKLFSSASTTYLGREYAGESDRQDIEQPNVCVYGTTVPSKLYSGLTPDDIRDGFLSRMLVFPGHPDPDPREDLQHNPPPEDLVERITEWWHWKPDAPEGTGNLEAIGRPWPVMADFNAGALAKFKSFRHTTRGYKAKVRGDRGLDSLWGRAAEHAQKIALVVACDRPGDAVVVDEQTAVYACRLVERLVRNLIVSVQDNVSETSYGQDQLRVLRAIKTLGEATLTQIGRLTQGMPPRVRREALEELAQQNRIQLTDYQGSRGPKTIAYRIVEDDAA